MHHMSHDWGWGVGSASGGGDLHAQIHGILQDTVNKRVVRILLECYVIYFNSFFCQETSIDV